MSPPLLKTVRTLKDSTFEACARISAHLKASASASGTAENGARAGRNDLKLLTIELRLLGGTLYSLESLIVELSVDNDAADSTLGITPSASGSENDPSQEWPIIDGYEILLTAIKSFHHLATSDGIKAARSSLQDIRSKLAFVLGISDTLEDISLRLTLLESEPLPQLLVQKEYDPEAIESPVQAPYDDEQGEARPEDVSVWLNILNSPENDREPAEYNKEITLVQSRRITEPAYRIAATRWPKYAEIYWQKLRPQVCSLFRVQKSYNFVQWVIEYARETYPRTFGTMALSPRCLLELTDALCNGSVLPLHIAAALGLPNLCRDLLSMGANVNQPGLLGTPLYCALVGSKVLITRTEPVSWPTLLVGNDSDVDQAATILLLVENGADCSFRYSWKDAAEEVSLAGLAFWAAMKTKHEAIFTNIIKGYANATQGKGSTDIAKGDALDSSFCLLLQREPVVKRGLLHRTRFARLLTYVYDLTLVDIETESTEHNWLQELVARLMVHANIKLSPMGDGKVDTLKDSNFAAAVRTAVLDFNVILVDRLIKDPRFSADFKHDKEETLLHMAAESAQNEILEMLIEAGADTRARDSSGRTPLMVCNEVSPMAKLILEHGVPTFDKDNGGRNVWHYFAATNEDDILKFLWDNDPYKIRNLNAVDEQGRTPLQAAFAHVEALQQSPKTSTSAAPFAAYFLLEKSQGYIRAEGNENLARWAVEWGNLGLVRQLFHLFPQANVNDELLLKSLNMSASPELVSLVLDRAGPSRPFADGTTAAETVIANVKLLKEGRLTRNPSSHPSCAPSMTRSAYMKLLTPEVIKSRDSKGRGIWLRFTQDILPLMSTNALAQPTSLYFLSSFMSMAVSCLVDVGALADYENESKKWAISCIATKGAVMPPEWYHWHMSFVATILVGWLSDRDRQGIELGIKGFFNEDEAGHLLWKLVSFRMPEVVQLLVQCGCDAHKPRRALDGRSVFEKFLADQPIDVSMIRPLLFGTTHHQLRRRQQYTFTELVRVADETVAVEVLEQLINEGLDVDGLEIPATSPMKSPLSSPSLLTIAICSKKILLGRLLIERGADASLAPPNSISAYLLAAKLGYVVILEMIIEKVGSGEFPWLSVYEHMEDRDTYNALQFAAAGGHRDALTTLLEATPLADKITATSPRLGRTCAHLATKAGSLDCVKILMRYSQPLFSVRDHSGRTPLFLAIVGGNQELIQYMKDNLLDYDNPQDMGIILLNPVPARNDNYDSDSDSLPESSHSEATHEQKISEPKQIGAMLADAIDHYQLSQDPLFKSILDHTSRKDLASAIMPCGGCTLLSYTAATNKIRPMLELVELGFTGFVAGCEEHWPGGYNALLCACLNIRKLMTTHLFIAADKARSFFKLCLDAYLKVGMSWFHLPISPIQALFHFRNSGPDIVYHQKMVLEIFIKHLTEHAQRYWAQMRATGVTSEFEFSANESIQQRVLRYALNLRKQVNPDNTAATHSTVLHDVIPLCFRDGSNQSNDLTTYHNVAKLLIRNGADVNAQDSELVTPLHQAAHYGQIDMVLTLLRAGANPNLLCANGASALGQSVAYGDFRVTRCLLSNGASPMTSFDITFETVNVDVNIMRQLIGLGADPYVTRPGTGSTLTNAIYESAEGMSLVLNGNFDFHRLAEQEPLLLSEILAHRKLSSMELKAIMKRMPHEYRARLVNFEPDDKYTPSFYIIRNDDPKLLQVLLDMGLYIEHEWHGKGTPLMFAASIGAFKCFKLLVRHGARLAYLTTGRRGEVIARSITEAAKLHPRLLQWALVDRHYETKYLTQAAHNGPFVPIKPWSGERRAGYRVSGSGDEVPQLPTESMLDLLPRIARMKRSMRGRVLLPVELCGLARGFEPR